ncbi:ADP-glyceromanno-heptose 6-epimerase [Bacteriovorax sp. Seq25_V]|uniref:ADP-glyceromanno-heptose 6-epimerase n=1 Tax=Bacteriovorax sp. Seq25_V TaxID=1201288 RepID=UPI00038A0059|nr:ADP-glyceromanno-heptose 6-epimerase [Bacteriovorax sp. Seq25_V]EQC46117.1 ADP-glyceromanno-heptose 6-epimerase [Bacteriovorax sp. Seq25_V]
MILVTGGAGFIGSVLVGELNKLGHKNIVIVDRLRDTTKWRNLRNLKYAEYIHADDLFLPEYADILDNLSCIYHIGACSATTQMDMDYLMRNNVLYSKNLFNLATELQIPFIYASSAATYGAGEFGYNDDHESIPKYKPLNPYGYSKQLFDEWVLDQENTPAHWFGLKFFNVYGPNEYHKEEMRSLVHKAHGQILETGKVKLFKSHKEGFKDGEQLRDFIYVKDVVRAIIELGKPSSAKGSGIYNLGAGKARSFYDLMVATFKAMGKEVNVEFIDMPMSIRNQYQYFTEANMEKFFKLLPDFKFSTLEEGVTDYVTSYLQKEDPNYNG